MNALALIEQYRDNHAGKSHYIDTQMTQAEQALKDACRMAEKSDYDFAQANLFLARSSMVKLVEAMPQPDSIRKLVIEIYMSIEDEISQEGGK